MGNPSVLRRGFNHSSSTKQNDDEEGTGKTLASVSPKQDRQRRWTEQRKGVRGRGNEGPGTAGSKLFLEGTERPRGDVAEFFRVRVVSGKVKP